MFGIPRRVKVFVNFLNNFAHNHQRSPNRICWLQWQGQYYRVTHCWRERTSSTKATCRCKCCFLIASESYILHKIELKSLWVGVPASQISLGLKKYTHPQTTVSLPFLSQLLECTRCIQFLRKKYSWTRSSPALTHATSQKLGLPRSPVTRSLPKRNGNSPSWCSLTYVQNSTLLITNYTTLSPWLLSLFPHLVWLSPHLLWKPFTPFPLASTVHGVTPIAWQVSYFISVASLMAEAMLYSCWNPSAQTVLAK